MQSLHSMKYFLSLTTLFLPLAVHAAPITDFKSFVGVIVDLINLLIIAIFALTFVVIVWAIIQTWIIGGGDEAQVAKGKKIITTSVVVLVIMSGIWAIIALLREGFFGI